MSNSDFVVVLVAAPALRLQGMDQAGLDIFLDRFPRNIAVALGLERALAQLRRQCPGAADEFGGSGNLLRRSSRPQLGNAHVKIPPFDARLRQGHNGNQEAAVRLSLKIDRGGGTLGGLCVSECS